MDDLANFLPARISGPVIGFSAALIGLNGTDSWRIFLRDRLKHPSPNAAHGEAAVAGALGVRLGGTSSYQGKISQKPYLGEPFEELTIYHIQAANRLAFMTGLVFGALCLACHWGGQFFLISLFPF